MMKWFVLSALTALLLATSGCGGTAAADCVPAAERCDGLDNDCDERIDEDAVDMDVFYADNDGDGYGGGVSLLACEAPNGYADNTRDCNDEDEDYHPGADESCTDENDYNCDGSVMYADADGDGVPACNDCDDSNPDVNPNEAETCNGIDDNCSGDIDDAPLAEMCGDGTNGAVGCRGSLGCRLLGCTPPFTDVDGDPTNGCECEDLVPAGLGLTCATAIDLGNLADSGATVDRMWNLARLSGEVWYKVRATDSTDTSCDNFHFDIQFASNPDDEFMFDVSRGSCAAPADPDTGLGQYRWATDMRANIAGRLTGQCPCTGAAAARQTNVSVCENDTATYYVRVYRNPTAPATCTTFGIANSNGLYDTP